MGKWEEGLTDAELIRDAEEPDNAAATSRGSDDRKAALRELRRRGYSEADASRISNGSYREGE